MHSAENGAEVQDLGAARHWYALYTRHQHEKSVAQALSNKGHEVFLPLVRATHRWQDRTKQLWLPLFPCYVFIRGGIDRRVQILSTPGMISVIAWAGCPAIIPPVQIDTVRRMIESTLQVSAYPFMQSGDRVRVVVGPLRGIEGILVRKRNMFRLVVSMEMLGRSAAVEIDISCVEASSSPLAPMKIQPRRFSASA